MRRDVHSVAPDQRHCRSSCRKRAHEAKSAAFAPDLRALKVPIDRLMFAPDNARRHADRDLAVIVESLRRFGQRKPVVGKRSYRGLTNVILAGNGTLEAARRLGWSHVAVAWFEGTDDEARQYALVDNRSAELSEWDFEALGAQLSDLQALDTALPGLLGWDESSLSALLGAEWQAPDAEPLPTEGAPEPMVTITLTRGQHSVLLEAARRLRRHEHDDAITEGHVIELLAADWLAGPSPDDDA